LSLEMHCCPSQQRMLAVTLVQKLDAALMKYSELVDTGRAKSLSVLELKLRVLLKGKVKVDQQQKKEKALPRQVASIFTAQSTCTLFRSRSTLFRTRSTARRTDQSGMSDGPSRSSPSPASMTDRSTEDEGRPSSRSSFTSESAEQDATRQFDKKRQKSQRGTADPLYASVIGLRSAPLSKFLQQTTLQWQLPMTSICESRLLMEIGVPNSERNQIMGLQRRASELGTLSGPGGLTEPQLVARAIGRLATDPPQLVGAMQRRTTSWLLRPFPEGLRFSGNNMSPLPCWLAGAQSICLNMSNNDVALQLHFALFKGSRGYVLKPSAMCARTFEDHQVAEEEDSEMIFWPTAREMLHRTTVRLHSLHNFPKRGERRLRLDGSRRDCHCYVPELSGANNCPPNNRDPAMPAISLTLHSIGGFCAISKELPLLQGIGSEIIVNPLAPRSGGGLNTAFGDTLHCIAAEPHATFLRLAVTDCGTEAAYETVVLGRIRHGYRVLQMRSMFGTRIELCYVFVHVSMGAELNVQATPRQQKMQLGALHQRIKALMAVNSLRGAQSAEKSTMDTATEGARPAPSACNAPTPALARTPVSASSHV